MQAATRWPKREEGFYGDGVMKRSLYEISKMDCPSEEQLIRMALSKFGALNLQFDLPNRQLAVVHEQNTERITETLVGLKLGAKFLKEEQVSESEGVAQENDESRVLWILLLINFTMFLVEIGIGFYAESTGLVADSFDMLADSIVYSVSLYAVGKAAITQHRAARLSGWFQLLLAFGAIAEVVRKSIAGSEPNSGLMMGISLVALCANVSCLMLLVKHRKGAVHMRASWVFSSNDVIANIGVLIAGGLVYFLKSPLPDLVIGVLIALIVARGALSIMKLSSVVEAID